MSLRETHFRTAPPASAEPGTTFDPLSGLLHLAQADETRMVFAVVLGFLLLVWCVVLLRGRSGDDAGGPVGPLFPHHHSTTPWLDAGSTSCDSSPD